MTKTRLINLTAMAGLFLVGPAQAVDHPGQKFHVSPASLAMPYATPAIDHTADFIPRPAGARPEAPKGFSVSVFAQGLTYARWMQVAPNGDVFIAEPTAGKVTLLRDSNAVGKSDRRFTFLSGLNQPEGLAIRDGYLYVGDLNAVWRTPYRDGDTKGGNLERFTKVKDLRPQGLHWERDLTFGPDGTLYLGLGSKDNISDFKPGAEVDAIDKTGNMHVFASGIRNAVGLAFAPGTNDLYVAVDERDGLGSELPPDYFTHVVPGGFYGYPYSYTGKNPDPNWGTRRPDLIAKAITPDVLFYSHSAPTGLTFYTGNKFPKSFQGDAFVSLHGSWNAEKPRGYKVVRIHFVNGKPDSGYENFVTGFWNGKLSPAGRAQVWGRPVGLAVAKDGSLLIADDVSNTIWRVVYTGK
jgi:glucose/arabinose dehydrogenase